MSAFGSKLRSLQGGLIAFWCPGCKESHIVSINSGVPGRDWEFNGNGDAPTFSPSVLITSGHFMQSHSGDCWCTFNEKHPDFHSKFRCKRCHSFVTNGTIQFLNDCSHELAGQTVPLPDFGDRT